MNEHTCVEEVLVERKLFPFEESKFESRLCAGKAATPQYKNKDGEDEWDSNNTVFADINKYEETIHEKLGSSNVATDPLQPTYSQTKHCNEASREALQIHGLRAVDISFFVASLQALDFHSLVGCGFRDMCIVSEKMYGWKTCFIFKCRVCCVELPVKTEEDCQEVTSLTVPVKTEEDCQEETSLTVPVSGDDGKDVPLITGGSFTNNAFSENSSTRAEVAVAETVSLKPNGAVFPPVKEGIIEELSGGGLQHFPCSSSVPAWTSLDNTFVGKEEVKEEIVMEEHPMTTTFGDPTVTEENEANIKPPPRTEALPGNRPNCVVYHDFRGDYYNCEERALNCSSPQDCKETKEELPEASKSTDKKKKAPVGSLPFELETGDKPYGCSECKEAFILMIELKKHLRLHTDYGNIVCNICGVGYKCRTVLKKHMMDHAIVRPYRCSKCSKTFRNKYNLKTHMLIHLGNKSFTCHMCDLKFTTSSNLKRHEATHMGDRPYVCVVCLASFTQKTSLVMHLTTHNKEKSFMCYICKGTFTRMQTLKQHLLTHQGEKPYKCEICNLRFSYKSNLHRHVAKHTGHKPHICSLCGAHFQYRCELPHHMTSHNHNTPFICCFCGTNFTRSRSLGEHINSSHPGETKFQCGTCGNKYMVLKRMLVHMLNHIKT